MTAPVAPVLLATAAGTGGRAHRRRWAGRTHYLLVGLLTFAAAVHLGGWTWLLLVWGLAPDVPLLFGAGAGLAHGQLHPRAVPAYNATHRLVGPLALTAVGAGVAWSGSGRGVVVAGLVWIAHVTLDRALGYGLRTPEGFQR